MTSSPSYSQMRWVHGLIAIIESAAGVPEELLFFLAPTSVRADGCLGSRLMLVKWGFPEMRPVTSDASFARRRAPLRYCADK